MSNRGGGGGGGKGLGTSLSWQDDGNNMHWEKLFECRGPRNA